MKITQDTVGTLTLDEFVARVVGIYQAKDEKRSIYDIWLHATHHASSIGEEVRKFKPGQKLFIEIADFAMWLFSVHIFWHCRCIEQHYQQVWGPASDHRWQLRMQEALHATVKYGFSG